MILAAGRGERMRPLTDNLPKPLLPVAGKPLLQYHVEALALAGFTELVINHARFGDMIEAYFADGTDFGVKIRYSAEGDDPLETGGGIKRALPLLRDDLPLNPSYREDLRGVKQPPATDRDTFSGGEHPDLPGDDPFLVINGDIWTDFSLDTLKKALPRQAHLVLVLNPAYHPGGDFALEDGWVLSEGRPAYTFSGIGVYRPSLFNSIREQVFPLAPVLRQAMKNRQVTGELHNGRWFDIGDPSRLAALENYLTEM